MHLFVEHEQTLTRYMKLPRKKEERSRVEANEDLFSMRKKFHQVRMEVALSLTLKFLSIIILNLSA